MAIKYNGNILVLCGTMKNEKVIANMEHGNHIQQYTKHIQWMQFRNFDIQ